MKTMLHPVLKIQLFSEYKCFGPGIAELMQQVEKLNSLRAAAQSMNMAYSKAWTTIRKCEKELGFQLLSFTAGGRNGGGARITEEGKVFLTQYCAYCEELRMESERLFSKYFNKIQSIE